MQDCNALQAMPALAQGAAAEDISHDLPLTDVSPSSLVDVVTPLESQEDVQTTLGTQQDHAAVYSPGPDTIPEQTPNQIAAVSVSGSTGSAAASKALAVRQSPSKHAKPEKQQLASAKSGKETVSLGATFPCVLMYTPDLLSVTVLLAQPCFLQASWCYHTASGQS